MGFEPTVGFPTLDFESSALNRTQPPFLEEGRNADPAYARSFGVASVKHPTSNFARKCSADNCVAVRVWSSAFRRRPWRAVEVPRKRGTPNDADRIVCFTRQKNVTIKRLPRLPILLHLVCPHGQPRYYLLLTVVHRFLAPLFTNIPNLFETSTPPLLP